MRGRAPHDAEILGDTDAAKKKQVRTNRDTKKLYMQNSLDVLREESEGFSNIVTLLNSVCARLLCVLVFRLLRRISQPCLAAAERRRWRCLAPARTGAAGDAPPPVAVSSEPVVYPALINFIARLVGPLYMYQYRPLGLFFFFSRCVFFALVFLMPCPGCRISLVKLRATTGVTVPAPPAAALSAFSGGESERGASATVHAGSVVPPAPRPCHQTQSESCSASVCVSLATSACTHTSREASRCLCVTLLVLFLRAHV